MNHTLCVSAVLTFAVIGVSGCNQRDPGLEGPLVALKEACVAGGEQGDYAACSELGHIVQQARKDAGEWDGNTVWTQRTRN